MLKMKRSTSEEFIVPKIGCEENEYERTTNSLWLIMKTIRCQNETEKKTEFVCLALRWEYVCAVGLRFLLSVFTLL